MDEFFDKYSYIALFFRLHLAENGLLQLRVHFSHYFQLKKFLSAHPQTHKWVEFLQKLINHAGVALIIFRFLILQIMHDSTELLYFLLNLLRQIAKCQLAVLIFYLTQHLSFKVLGEKRIGLLLHKQFNGRKERIRWCVCKVVIHVV